MIDTPTLTAFARLNHWTASGQLYTITNHEATVKSRNIEEKLDFEREWREFEILK